MTHFFTLALCLIGFAALACATSRQQRDLFGGTSLIREWGRIGTRGHMLIEPHRDEGEAITALMRLARVKRRRGYQG